MARFEWPDAIIEEQPVRIYFWENDKRHHYTPDFLVRRPHITPLLLEVKPTEKLSAALKPKFDTAHRYARNRGWRFEVWTEQEITRPRMENARFLTLFRDKRVDPKISTTMLSAIRNGNGLSVDQLMAIMAPNEGEREAMFPHLWALLANGRVQFDPHEKILPKTILTVLK